MSQQLEIDAVSVRARVLVVDDDIEIRFLLAEVFRSSGFSVAEAYNADEATTLLGCTPFDVVITDVQMPGPFDGLALAKSIRSCFPHILVVVVSGLDLSRQVDPEHTVFFRKPYSISSLVDYVKSKLTRS